VLLVERFDLTVLKEIIIIIIANNQWVGVVSEGVTVGK